MNLREKIEDELRKLEEDFKLLEEEKNELEERQSFINSEMLRIHGAYNKIKEILKEFDESSTYFPTDSEAK
jgi:chromosome segregation ATPase